MQASGASPGAAWSWVRPWWTALCVRPRRRRGCSCATRRSKVGGAGRGGQGLSPYALLGCRSVAPRRWVGNGQLAPVPACSVCTAKPASLRSLPPKSVDRAAWPCLRVSHLACLPSSPCFPPLSLLLWPPACEPACSHGPQAPPLLAHASLCWRPAPLCRRAVQRRPGLPLPCVLLGRNYARPVWPTALPLRHRQPGGCARGAQRATPTRPRGREHIGGGGGRVRSGWWPQRCCCMQHSGPNRPCFLKRYPHTSQTHTRPSPLQDPHQTPVPADDVDAAQWFPVSQLRGLQGGRLRGRGAVLRR